MKKKESPAQIELAYFSGGVARTGYRAITCTAGRRSNSQLIFHSVAGYFVNSTFKLWRQSYEKNWPSNYERVNKQMETLIDGESGQDRQIWRKPPAGLIKLQYYTLNRARTL